MLEIRDKYVSKILNLDSVLYDKFAYKRIYLWPYCRQYLYKLIQPHGTRTVTNKRKLLLNVFRILRSHIKLRKADNLYLISNRNQIFELINQFNKDQNVFGSKLIMFQIGHESPRRSDAVFTDMPKIVIRFLARIVKPERLSTRMRFVFYEALVQYYYFKIVYFIVRPKTVYFINWYDFYPALVALPKSIKSVEIQHGIIHDLHLGYNFGNINPLFLRVPDVLALWDLKNYNNIKLKHNPVLVKYKNRKISQSADIITEGKKFIIISQHSIRLKIESRLPELLEEYQGFSEYIYRLHPKDNYRIKEIEKSLTTLPSLKVETSEGDNFSQYLSDNNLFCGVYSTLFLDLITAGYNCVVLNLSETNRIKGLLDSHNVTLF